MAVLVFTSDSLKAVCWVKLDPKSNFLIALENTALPWKLTLCLLMEHCTDQGLLSCRAVYTVDDSLWWGLTHALKDIYEPWVPAT